MAEYRMYGWQLAKSREFMVTPAPSPEVARRKMNVWRAKFHPEDDFILGTEPRELVDVIVVPDWNRE